jgi:hypothetical protein
MAATDVVVVIGGQIVTPFARVGRVRIDDLLNDAPNTAAVTIVAAERFAPVTSGAFDPGAFDRGAFATATTGGVSAGGFWSGAFDPTAFATAQTAGHPITPPPILPGAPIAIYLGAIDPALQIFGGQISNREQYAELDIPKHVRYDLSCVDFSRRLNHRTVTTEYLTASVTTIVVDLITRFAPGITVAHVQPGLPSISGMTFTFEDVSGALSRLAREIGAYWYVDYVGDLHFFIGTEPGAAPAPLVPGGRFADFKVSADLTQVRTRIIVEAAGATAAATLPAPDTLIPVSTAIPFPSAGGRAKIGTTIVTYTGTNPGGVKANTTGPLPPGTPNVDPIPPPAAPGAPAVALAPTSTAGNVSGGPYTYAVTLELSDGRRSDASVPSAPVTIVAAADPPPTTATLPTPPIAGPIRAGATATYATSFVDAAGNETVATKGGNVLTGRAVAAPAGFVPVNASQGGEVDLGYRVYRMTYVTAAGETTPSPLGAVVQTIPGFQTEVISLQPSSDPRVVASKYYRSTTSQSTAGAAMPYRFVMAVNLSGQINDISADAALPTAALPITSTADTPEGAIVTIPTSGDPRIVARRLYRKDGAGEYRLVAHVPDNTTTTFSDTLPSSGGNLAPTVNRVTTGAVLVSAIPLGPAGTVRRRLFRTAAGGSQMRELVAFPDNTTTTYTDPHPDTALGGAPLPAEGIPGSPGSAGAGMLPTLAGATAIELDALTGFPSAGWILVEQQVIRYRDRATTDGRFYLTGIPAAGSGAITADILAGTVVATIPALVGVNPAIKVTIGDEVQLIVIVDDLAAQTALAAVEGGDGVVEHYIQDRRLSDAGARARALAELALFKTIETRIMYTTHDPNTRSGRTVHVDLPAPTNVAGDFLIQRVTIDDLGTAIGTYPRRQVDASTTRFSFDDVLARLLLEQT